MLDPHCHRYTRAVALFALLSTWIAGPLAAQPVEDTPLPTEVAAPSPEQAAIQRLAELRRGAAEKRQEQAALQRAVRNARAEDRPVLQSQVEELGRTIEKLDQTFAQIATGGIDLAALTDQPPAEIDWKAELLDVSRPLLAAVKEITEKPRRIEKLRSDILRNETRLKAARKAIDSVQTLLAQSPSQEVAVQLKAIAGEWGQHAKEAQDALQVATFQLEALQDGSADPWAEAGTALAAFLTGRGQTLGLATLAVLSLALLMRGLGWLSLHTRRKPRPFHAYLKRVRTLRYLFTALFAASSVTAVLLVFYLRSDLLLFSLTLFALLMVAIGLRNTVPKYMDEIRLLLDMGPVRTGERIAYQGVPYRVKSIQMYTTLRNPELRGALRVPLAELRTLISRPGADEPWFPSSDGDFVMLPDNVFARVVRQTPESVYLSVMAGPVQIPTATYLGLRPRNLSREGFVVPVTFGIDYRHQAICLTEVPAKLRAALMGAIEAQPYAADLADLVVDFKEASAHSLDYILVAVMRGTAAGSNFDIGRLIQKTCVELCNREGWVIPFQQLTLHAGDGLGGNGSLAGK